MGIKVISQNTAERRAETQKLFEQIEPLLNEGYSLTSAVKEIKGLNNTAFQQRAWYKELRDFAIEQGYSLKS